MMKNCPLCESAKEYRDFATAYLKPVCAEAGTKGKKVFEYVSDMLAQCSFFNVSILKMMWVLSGILIGSMCSDFFKKHRRVVIVALVVSIALFVYKVYQSLGEWDDESEF